MILLIEDNPGDVVLFEKALRPTGSTCTVARTADGALRLLSSPRARFAVVVVDLRLPGMDGWVVLEYLRNHPRDLQTVILTSSANERDRARAAALGVEHYLIKSDDFATLADAVRQIAALDR